MRRGATAASNQDRKKDHAEHNLARSRTCAADWRLCDKRRVLYPADDGSGIACSISTKQDRVKREKLAWQQKVRSDRTIRTLRKIARIYRRGQR